jgi:hypothetical protein
MWESPTKVSSRKNNVQVVLYSMQFVPPHCSVVFSSLLYPSMTFHGFLCMTCGIALGSVVTHGCVFTPKHLQAPQPLAKVLGLELLGQCLNPLAVPKKVKKVKKL